MSGRFSLQVGLIGLGVLACLAAVMGVSQPPFPQESGYISVGRPTSIPYGWINFCNRYDDECDNAMVPARDVKLTPLSYEIVQNINIQVNKSIIPMLDIDHWGVVNQWMYPIDGYGDCKDYALLKRKLLIEKGFPRQGLLMTIVKDLQGNGHAVLTVKTDHGELILDNLTNEIKSWRDTGYKFVKRQAQTNQNVWVDLGTPDSRGLMAAQ